MNELDAKFQEKPIWIGTVTPKVKATLLVNQSTGTWSLLIIDEKSACGVAAGEGYSYRAPTKTGLTL